MSDTIAAAAQSQGNFNTAGDVLVGIGEGAGIAAGGLAVGGLLVEAAVASTAAQGALAAAPGVIPTAGGWAGAAAIDAAATQTALTGAAVEAGFALGGIGVENAAGGLTSLGLGLTGNSGAQRAAQINDIAAGALASHRNAVQRTKALQRRYQLGCCD